MHVKPTVRKERKAESRGDVVRSGLGIVSCIFLIKHKWRAPREPGLERLVGGGMGRGLGMKGLGGGVKRGG